MSRQIAGSARDILGWMQPDELTADDLGEYETVVEDTLDALGIDDAGSASDDVALKAIARWKVWERVRDSVALDYDESQGDRSTSLSQMGDKAAKQANHAYFDALPYNGGYRVKCQVIQRSDHRFGRGVSPRKDALRNA